MRIKLRSLLLLSLFVAITGSFIAVTGLTFSRVRFDEQIKYQAVFTDASGLRPGADVRASGVALGTVKSISLDESQARVEFSVSSDVPMTQSTLARIRYANLTGDRYLDLSPGNNPAAPALTEDATIPVERTLPALDLDSLFAGFDPLMQALDAEEVNQLTSNILAVTDGQAGAVETLLSHVASLTSTLANREDLIGDTITNLTQALGTIDEKRTQVETLIVGLADLTKGLAADRHAIGGSLAGLNLLASDTARLLRRIRPDLKANLDQIAIVATALNKQSASISEVLDLYPSTIQRLGRGGAYGSFFNFFICSVEVMVTLPGQPSVAIPPASSEMDRCVNKER